MKKDSSKFIETAKKFKNDPVYNAGLRLGLYFIFFVVFFIMFFLSGVGGKRNTAKNKTTKEVTTSVTTSVAENNTKSYGEMLSDLYYSKTNGKINVTKSDNSIYYIEFSFDKDVITGTYEDSNNVVKKFKYKENVLYEIDMGKEVVNSELLNSINTAFLNFRDFFAYFSENSSIQTKKDDYILYTYNNLTIKDELFTSAIVTVQNNKVTKINLQNDNATYEYQFEIQGEE